MRVGIFGGSFDPVHIGHIHIANIALRHLQQIWFVPSHLPPHKKDKKLTPIYHRIQMLKIAIRKQPRFRISDIESSLPTPSYTLQTVKTFREKHPSFSFYLVIGTDTLIELPTWFCAEELMRMVDVISVEREGFDEERTRTVLKKAFGDEICGRLMKGVIRGDVVRVSSTEIRAALMEGKDVTHLLPSGVMNYIKEKKLYGWRRHK